VGTGAGIPGIILAIVKEETNFTLLDSNSKKISFVKRVAIELELNNITTINERVEKVTGTFDLVISRAVAPLDILLEITSLLVEIGGKFIFYKGKNIDDEICENLLSNKYIGVSFIEIIKYNLGDNYSRSLIIFEKISLNKDGYPRQYSKIKLESLCK
jgi:16S rRNA (guanine527-N7)-methyltransferase